MCLAQARKDLEQHAFLDEGKNTRALCCPLALTLALALLLVLSLILELLGQGLELQGKQALAFLHLGPAATHQAISSSCTGACGNAT